MFVRYRQCRCNKEAPEGGALPDGGASLPLPHHAQVERGGREVPLPVSPCLACSCHTLGLCQARQPRNGNGGARAQCLKAPPGSHTPDRSSRQLELGQTAPPAAEGAGKCRFQQGGPVPSAHSLRVPTSAGFCMSAFPTEYVLNQRHATWCIGAGLLS